MSDEAIKPGSDDPMAKKDIDEGESITAQQIENENNDGFASKVKDLLRTYGNPKDSTQHARYGENIKSAVSKRDKDLLIQNLRSFGSARCNQPGEQYQRIEMFCSMESNRIIAALEAMPETPWQELADQLEITFLNNLNKTQPVEITQEQQDAAKKVVEEYVVPLTEDQGFDEETKEKLAKYVLDNPRKFSAKANYKVTIDDVRITFKASFPGTTSFSEGYIYLNWLKDL